MEQLSPGDYVIFKYGDSSLTGLISSVIGEPGSLSYEIIPNAIGFDGSLTVDSSAVKKATSKLTK